jgi:hypothetical protein
MANDLKVKYGTEAQAITITLASLAAAAAREGTIVDNTTNLFLDAYVQVQVRTNASAPSGQKAVNLWCYGTVDAALPLYPDPITGSDAGVTLNAGQLQFLGQIQCPSASTTYKSVPFSISKALGIYLPEKWGIVVENQTGNALDSTGTNFKAEYQGVLAQVV